MRIAVIGSGAAGMCCVHQLHEKGYRDITVLEKAHQPGGQIRTLDIDGRNYDVGAILVASSFHELIDVVESYGLTLDLLDKTGIVHFEWGGYLSRAQQLRLYVTRILPMLWRYLPVRKKIVLPEHGFAGIDREELGCTFTEWSRRHNVSRFDRILSSLFTSWGFGYLEKVSPMYVHKVLTPYRIRKGFLERPWRKIPLYQVREGYQTLIHRIARKCKMELGITIKKVERSEQISIETDRGLFEFDRLIIACSPDRTLEFLDLSEKERALFSKILHLDFHTIACRVDNFDTLNLGFVLDNLTPDMAGRITSFYKRWNDTNVVLFYILTEEDETEAELVRRIEEDVAKLGGTVKELLRHVRWEIFSHVSPSDIRDGFYDDLESLQGVNNTVYTGDLHAFPLVGYIASYSMRVVNTHFEDAN